MDAQTNKENNISILDRIKKMGFITIGLLPTMVIGVILIMVALVAFPPFITLTLPFLVLASAGGVLFLIPFLTLVTGSVVKSYRAYSAKKTAELIENTQKNQLEKSLNGLQDFINKIKSALKGIEDLSSIGQNKKASFNELMKDLNKDIQTHRENLGKDGYSFPSFFTDEVEKKKGHRDEDYYEITCPYNDGSTCIYDKNNVETLNDISEYGAKKLYCIKIEKATEMGLCGLASYLEAIFQQYEIDNLIHVSHACKIYVHKKGLWGGIIFFNQDIMNAIDKTCQKDLDLDSLPVQSMNSSELNTKKSVSGPKTSGVDVELPEGTEQTDSNAFKKK